MDLRKRDSVERWRRESGGFPAGARALTSRGAEVRQPVGPRGWMVVGAGCLVGWLALVQWSGSAAVGATGACAASSPVCAVAQPTPSSGPRTLGAAS